MTVASVLLLCLAFIALSYRSYRRLDRRRLRILLWMLRALLLACLVCAFIQPSFRFDRLLSRENAPVILIDASKSMQLFDVDPAIAGLQRAVRNAVDGKTRPFLPFRFGDSLRPAPDIGRLSFDDARSFCPESWDGMGMRDARRVLIVSDGNWSNASLPLSAFEDRDCWYAPLAKIRSRPFLRVETDVHELTAPADSPATVRVGVNGYSSRPQRVSVRCIENGTVVASRELSVDSGLYADTAVLTLTSHSVGQRLCATTATTAFDSLDASAAIVHTVVPVKLTTALYDRVPRVDRRFVLMVLADDAQWTTVAPATGPDLLVIMDWDAQARSLVSGLKPSAAVLLYGCVPCDSTETVPTAPDASLVTDDQSVTGMPFSASAQLPPLNGILRCAGPRPASRAGRILSLSINRPGSPADTVALLQRVELSGHHSLVVAGREMWRWDFWPRSVGADTGEMPFSRFVLALARQQVVANKTGAFLLVPSQNPLREGEPAVLDITVPADANAGSPAAVAEVAIRVDDNSGRIAFDTSVTVAPGYDRTVRFSLPSLTRGTWRCRTELKSGRTVIRSRTDTLRVGPDDSEFQVAGQNTALLGQIARPLDPGDTTALRNFLAPDTDSRRRTTSLVFRIGQTWPLLILIFALLGIEWLIRRRLSLD